MKLSTTILLLALALSNFSCVPKPDVDIEKTKSEILQVEKEFNDMAAREGVKEAFLEFAAEDAVLNRRGGVVKGKQEIREYYENQSLTNVSLQWEPEFVDVSSSGDMAYTYGPFTFSATDTTGQELNASGIFHTVWKRQSDGSWKYVYD